ncbi:MAG TPA: DUF2007 domain-containing protein [Planctomycetota bacterium]|nr:DUF2007 domain-containing protein [Planctomycetota bacterium]
MVTVYATTDPRQVAIIQIALRDAGIAFEVANETSSYAVGLPSPAVPIEVLVRKEDQQSAIRAIEHALRAIGEAPHPQ